MTIQENLKTIKSELPKSVTLVAVSKTKPAEDIMAVHNTGHLDFGENKVQDMAEKFESLPKNIRWHMIGHVQRNKVKYMAEFVHLIHGVDSLKLLKEINKHAMLHNRIINCLLQIKIAKEDSKFGLSIDGARQLIESSEFKNLENIKILGLMGMATYTDNKNQIKEEFNLLTLAFNDLKNILTKNCDFSIISMGMSADYNLAIECGSTMVRIGSSIFGSRN